MKIKVMVAIQALFCLSMLNETSAQRVIGGEKFKDHLYYGGNIGLSFTGNYVYAQVSPRIGYMVTNNFSVGTGATYIYISSKLAGGSSSVYGGNLFARHNFLKQFFAQTEFELLNVRYSQFDIPSEEMRSSRTWVPGWFVGGGVFQSLGGRGGLSLAGYYNLLYDRKKSPYSSPFVVRAGFSF